jgi:NAD(P)-dependent dehydrogenase (short-subunit alcohol dehydrogenase family)
MPTLGDVRQFFFGQAFGKVTLPDIDLSGRTIVITGANTGLGLDAAKHLYESPNSVAPVAELTYSLQSARLNVSRLVFACRNLEKGEAAKAAVISEAGDSNRLQIDVWQVDLDQFSSVRAFCTRVNNELDRIDGFIANAGVELMEYEQSEGLERTLTVNVVSTFYMVTSIWHKLQETTKQYNIDTRLSVVGSLIHCMAPEHQLDVPEDVEILKALSDRDTADMSSRYPLSKLIVHLLFANMAHHAPAQSDSARVIFNLVNPGWCGTELGRVKEQGIFERICFRVMGRTSEDGGRTLAHAVTAGRESDREYLSECMVKPQSEYLRSEKGAHVGKRIFGEVLKRIQAIDRA